VRVDQVDPPLWLLRDLHRITDENMEVGTLKKTRLKY
jgi:hypothetical protein